MESEEKSAAVEESRMVRTKILRSLAGVSRYDTDQLTVEEPLEIALRVGKETFSLGVAFRTPGDDEALVIGMLKSEGIISSMQDVVSIRQTREEGGTVPATRISIRVAEGLRFDSERFSRVFPISAACGACGKSALKSLRIDRDAAFQPSEGIFLSDKTVSALPGKLLAAQSDFRKTGSLHAAARFDGDGKLLAVSEDIGRHNAMDKLVGSHLQSGGRPWSEQVILFSGRVGYDLMQKVIAVGCPFVVSIGAPSSFTVELANLYKITLLGFLRDDRFNVYSAPHRIRFSK